MNVNGSAGNIATMGPPVPRRIQKGRLMALENDPNKVKGTFRDTVRLIRKLRSVF